MQRILSFAPGGARLRVEVAASPSERRMGLSYRTSLGASDGMIFIMPIVMAHRMVTTEMKFRLDMLFVDEAGVVVGLLEDVPLPPPAILWGVDEPSKWVIETNAGWCRANGVRVGSSVSTEAR